MSLCHLDLNIPSKMHKMAWKCSKVVRSWLLYNRLRREVHFHQVIRHTRIGVVIIDLKINGEIFRISWTCPISEYVTFIIIIKM